jgi:hypothetical protein
LRPDFLRGDDSALAIITPPVFFFDHGPGENPASIVEVEPTFSAIAGILRLVSLKQQPAIHST